MSGSLRVAMPARVESYDADRQCVDVQPAISDLYERDGERVAERLPVITDVPVHFPGSGGYRVTWPIARGSEVLLVFCSSSLDEWKARGGGEVAPSDDRRHHLNDAIAIPGVHALSPPTTAPTDAMVVHAPVLRLGGPAAAGDVVVQSALTAFMLALDAAIPSAGTAASALTALKAALQALNGGLGWRAGTAKTKAE